MADISDNTKKRYESDRFLYTRTKYVYDYALETWYPQLKHATLESQFIQLTLEEMEALYHSCLDKMHNSADTKKTTDKDKEILQELSKKITEVIETQFGGQAFAKLNTRSPKDALSDKVNKRLKSKLMEELNKSDGTPNGDTCAFVQATRRALMVCSGDEVLKLFTKSSRIREDLAKALTYPNEFPVIIIIREWKDILAKNEFRGFVSKRKLTALSQYCYMQYYPELVKEKKKYKRLIKKFFESIKDSIPMENSVVDFGVFEDGTVKIIEINPFFHDTSACLFDWKNEKDNERIRNGPFKFRIVKQPVEDPLSCLSIYWRKFIEEYRGISRKSRGTKNL